MALRTASADDGKPVAVALAPATASAVAAVAGARACSSRIILALGLREPKEDGGRVPLCCAVVVLRM